MKNTTNEIRKKFLQFFQKKGHTILPSIYKNDEETYKIWIDIIKIPPEHIIKIGDKDNCKYHSENFWQMGDTGPCGPCTEIFYNYDAKKNHDFSEFLKNKNEYFIEIWNIVFIEYN
ncbi:alanine--tRNA ligase, cytoplasmic-like, partial [Aphis craccivora]